MGPQAIAGLLAGITIALLVVAALQAVRLRQERELRGREARRRPLEGELVVVNTPLPDDQSIKGVVELELDNGLLVLRAARYLQRDRDRDHGDIVHEVPAGNVVVAGPLLGSWVQVLYADRSA